MMLSSGRRADLLAAALLLALIARRWWQMGPYPTGLDGGQWLAFGRGLLGGPGRDTPGAYAPLVPLLAATGQRFLGPEMALKLIAIGSFVAVVIMVWLIAHDGLGPWPGLAVTALIAPASALTEPVAFGGYPQQLALAALLLGGWGVSQYLAQGRRRWLLTAGAGLALAALSHHIYYLLAVSVTAGIWLLWMLTRPPGDAARRRTFGAAGIVAISALLFLPTGRAFLTASYAPPLAAAGLDRPGAWAYGTREAVIIWSVLALAGVGGLILVAAHRRPVWRLAVSLVVIPGVLLLASAEARLVPPLLIGLALGAGYGLCWLATHLTGSGTWRERVPLALAVALPLLLLRSADGEATAFFQFYRVLDRSLIATAAAVTTTAPRGLVAVRADSRGWPVGWWLEGLTTAPLAIGSDDRWLGFPAERARAAVVASLFVPGLTGPEVRAIAAAHGIELLVIPKWEWIGWQRWTTGINAPVTVIYDDNEHLILRLQPAADLPAPE